MAYFSGQGRILVAKLENNVPGAFRFVGNVPSFSPSFETSKLEHKESYTGHRTTDKVITTENKANVSITLEDWNAKNLAIALRGSVGQIAAGTFATLTAISDALATEGDELALGHQNVTNVVLEDSAGVPATLVEGTDYTIDEDFGSITLGDVSSFTLPINVVSYDFAALDSSPFFTEGSQEYAIRFEGVNTADNNAKVLVELYKVQFDPTQEIPLISDDLAQFVLEGNALLDPSKTADAVYGQFGRLTFLNN